MHGFLSIFSQTLPELKRVGGPPLEEQRSREPNPLISHIHSKGYVQ